MMGKIFSRSCALDLDRSVGRLVQAGWPWLGLVGGGGNGTYSSSKGQIAKLVELRIGLLRECKVR